MQKDKNNKTMQKDKNNKKMQKAGVGPKVKENVILEERQSIGREFW